MSAKKKLLALVLLGVLVGLLPVAGVSAPASEDHRNNILFTLQDKGTRFDPGGTGLQVGTATGKINGVSITNFKFEILPPPVFPAFTFDNRAGITDTDGDQIIFHVLGAGTFVFPPLLDPAPPASGQVLGGFGGPVSGTYEVVATSGKYSRKFQLGQKFRFKAVGYNPSPTAVGTDPFGAVYIEVYSNKAKED